MKRLLADAASLRKLASQPAYSFRHWPLIWYAKATCVPLTDVIAHQNSPVPLSTTTVRAPTTGLLRPLCTSDHQVVATSP